MGRGSGCAVTEGCQAYGAAASGEKVSVFDAPPENVKLHIGVTRPVWCRLNSSFSPSLSLALSLSVGGEKSGEI